MTDLTESQFFPRTKVTETACILLRLTAIVAGLLLTAMPFLPGCGEGEQTGSEPSGAPAGATACVTGDSVQAPADACDYVGTAYGFDYASNLVASDLIRHQTSHACIVSGPSP